MKLNVFRSMLATATVLAATMISFADDEPAVDSLDNPDVWAEITYNDIPDEVKDRMGAGTLIPFDVGSYIQSGLWGHFDAIRNAGAALPHDPAAAEWKNLVSGYPDAEFTDNAGHWRSGYSYYFNGKTANAYAQLKSKMNVGANITAQIVTTVDYTKQQSGTEVYPIFFHDGVNDFSVFFNNRWGVTQKLLFKADKFGGASASRPAIEAWDGKYATAILDDGSIKLIGESASSVKPRNQDPDSLNYQFRWFGTTAGAYPAIVGDCHAVRIYNRGLSDSELAWNRMLDEVRYRNADTNVNVIVESNVAGVEANEPTGRYMVNGQHVFTAPESVFVNGCTYIPSGYTLEVWDAAGKSWGEPELHTGEKTFAYTNCIARSKVRIIWDWTLQSGVKRYDADSYVQGGLLLNFDGIRNAGLHAPHSTDTEIWANLGSLNASRDATLGAAPDSAHMPGEWTDRGYEFRGANHFTSGGTADFGQRMTAQVVTDSSPMWRNTYRRRWPSPMGCTEEDNVFIIYGNSNKYLDGTYYFQSTYATSGQKVEISSWNGRFFNVIVSTNLISLSDGETTKSNNSGAFQKNSDGLTMVVGSSKANDNYKARYFAGRIHAARWYNRVLTPDEIKRNNDIDWCRFFGASGRSSETDLVEVCSERPDITVEGKGVYVVRGSESRLSVSAPATVNVGDKVYSCKGYCIETWDAAAKTWGNPVVAENATSCVIDGTTGGANRRVTWLWTLTQGLLKASDYDVSDYVWTGLVGHFDGVRNQGADMPSSNVKEALWRNLVTDDPDAIIKSSAGVWTNGVGFYFTGAATDEYAKMKDQVSLGPNSTVQVTCNVDYKVQGSGAGWYPAVFSDESNHYCIFFRNNSEGKLSEGLEMNADGYGTSYGSKRPKMIPWGGKYMTAILGAGYSWMFEGTTFANQTVRNTKTPLTKCYAWGGCPDTGFNSGFKGEIDAVRIYNRVLTESEIAHNRKVDEIRYRGKFADYANLIIVNDDDNASPSLPAGEYELTGNATITAADVIMDEKLHYPKLRVERWNGNGWESGEKTDGYTYTASGAGKVRLTYTWIPRTGFMLVVR